MTLENVSILVQKFGESLTGNQLFTWKGYDYPCIPASAANFVLLDEGGFQVNVSLILKARQEVFADGIFPEAQDRVTFAGQKYRVFKVNNDALNTMLVLILTSDSKGA